MSNLRDVKDFEDLRNLPNLNEQVIDDFRANEGRVGGPFEGARIVLIHHVGARTGTKRLSPMAYFPQADGSMVIVASNSGAPENPAWYHNLKANPRTDVEVGAERWPVLVEEINGKERDAIWTAIVAIIPAVGEYQKAVSRTIPLLRLSRLD